MNDTTNSIETAQNVRRELILTQSEARSSMDAAISMLAEIERLHNDDEDRCPGIEAHLRSLHYLLRGLDSCIDHFKSLTA